jgi:hypothetical protein
MTRSITRRPARRRRRPADTSSLILGSLDHRHGSPDHELAAVLRDGSSNVVELRPQPKPPARRRASTQGQVFQLKVTLAASGPPHPRRVRTRLRRRSSLITHSNRQPNLQQTLEMPCSTESRDVEQLRMTWELSLTGA